MNIDYLPYLIPYILSLAISTGVGVFTWRRRQVAGALPFAIVAFAQASATLGYIFELASDTLGAKIFWDDFQWIGFAVVAPALLMFALAFSGRKPAKSRRAWGLLLLPSAVFLLLAASNPWHGLTRANAALIPAEPFSILVYDFTPLTYGFSLYIYAMMLAAFYFLGRMFIHAQRIYRVQIAAVIVGISIPMIGSVFALADVTLTAQRDMTPLTFAIGNLIVAWGLFRYRLFDVAPIAWETVISNMHDAVIVLDAENRVIDLNRAGRILIPLTEKRAIGMPARQFFAKWPDKVEQFLSVAQINGEITFGEGENRRYFEMRITPIYSRRQRRLGRVIVLRNITDRKTAEEQLRQYAAALETSNRELEKARLAAEADRRRAEEADQMKSQFLASMSHELRTPMNAIMNFTEIVALGMVGPVNEKQKEILTQSLDSSTHLLNLINDILDISKIQAGKLALFIEKDVNLHEELQTVVDMVEPLLQDRPVTLVQDIDADLPSLSGDKRRIRQIMLNLLSNAAKFTEEGCITLSVKNRGDHILVAVTDTGPGISEEMQALVFEPFTQTEDGVRHVEGTGLGLPITKNLAEAHGGELWLESEGGDGAAFYVTLPVDGER